MLTSRSPDRVSKRVHVEHKRRGKVEQDDAQRPANLRLHDHARATALPFGSKVLMSGPPKGLGRDDGPATGCPHHILLRRQSLPASSRYGVGASARSTPSCFSSAQSADGIV